MNLMASIALSAGGPGSGCQGANCGRRYSGIHLVKSPSNFLSGKATHRFEIHNDKGESVGELHVHMAEENEVGGYRKLPKNTLVVDMISSHDTDKEMPTEAVREIGRALKTNFPETKFVAGMRISGVRYDRDFRELHRQASVEERKELAKKLWTVVPLRASAEIFRMLK